MADLDTLLNDSLDFSAPITITRGQSLVLGTAIHLSLALAKSTIYTQNGDPLAAAAWRLKTQESLKQFIEEVKMVGEERLTAMDRAFSEHENALISLMPAPVQEEIRKANPECF